MITDLQKASMTKRISAYLFDSIMLVVLILAVALLMSAVLGVQGYINTLNDGYDRYEKEYGVKFGISQEELEKLSPAERENFDTASKALSADKEAMYAYSMLINLVLIITTVSILCGYLIWEFAIPLKLGNGQTLGKKIFGIALMRIDGVKLNTVSLFVRTVLGKFTIETMIPVLILMLVVFGGLGLLGTMILGLILLLQVVLLITSRTNALIHDKLANTVVVDMATQMIFASELEMIAYKEKLHAEKAVRQVY